MRSVALPVCNVRLAGRRPRELPRGYPRELKTLGDHIRKRRLDLGLFQRNRRLTPVVTFQRTPATSLGVRGETLATWERGQASPSTRNFSAVVRFLGHDPEPAYECLAGRVRARRRALGLSQAELAVTLALDEGTIADIERGRRRMSRRVADAVRLFLEGADAC